MTGHNIETEITAGQVDVAFTGELSDEALDRDEGRDCFLTYGVDPGFMMS